MDLTKGIALVQSKVFWSAVMTLVAILAKQFGLPSLLSWASDPNTTTTILNVVAVIGSVGAIVFRSTATAQVTSVLPPRK